MVGRFGFSSISGLRLASPLNGRARHRETCCGCGAHNKPKGRIYRCRVCGLVCHRVANGTVINQVCTAVYGTSSRIQPHTSMDRRLFAVVGSGT